MRVSQVSVVLLILVARSAAAQTPAPPPEQAAPVGWQPWTIPGRGSMQWINQLSWLRRAPWSNDSAPSSAQAVMFLTQIRYNLP
jgi:hypothetical protein